MVYRLFFIIFLTASALASTISKHDIEKFAIVMAQIQHYYIKDTDTSKLFDNAIKGMLINLDPHSAYLTSTDFKDLESTTSGKYAGIGVQITLENDLIKIISPLDGTPAAKANLEPGDIILKINDIFVKDIEPNKAITLLSGKAGTKVKLTLFKASTKKPETITLQREIIKLHSVTSKLLTSNIGYIRVATFGDTTAKEIKNSIKKMPNIKGLVVDVRNNPGGTLPAATSVCDLFLDADKLKNNKKIVSTEGRIAEMNTVINATKGEIFNNKPIIILINKGSASASEIFASALSEHNRAITLGTKTFGKGSIQTLIPITNDSAIKITTGLYYTPRGEAIQAKGVAPDVLIPYTSAPKAEKMLEEIIDESQLYKHLKSKPKSLNKVAKKDISAEIAQKDFQLYQAIKLLNGLMALHD